ncbi:MAG: ATP-binding cassette domain-containing protein [Clostridiales bacterium]|nr:ATP-binding cassette domain-containing protein [Clostridiales bacterium]
MIQIKNIVKDYATTSSVVHALKSVSINFRNSEFVSILGPSGCGKTTMLNIIGGLDKYTSGDIVINGVSTKEYKDKDWDAYRNHYIGFVFQSYNLIGHLSILENVELALSIAGLNKKEKRKRALKALKEVGLDDQIKKKPNQLSGGQMQRVAIARAIVNEPKIILADEPTGALDSETSVQVMDILKKISDKYLIIMVTHNEDLANMYSTRIISILDGEVKHDTNPYIPSEEEIAEDKVTYEKKDVKEKERKKKKKIKSAMGYGTAFNLSLKNLWSKKGKTIVESLAGSIGIIGIALVLAVSSGFSNYINNLQSDTLGGYPLNIGMVAANMDAIKNGGLSNAVGELNKETSDDALGIYDTASMMEDLGHLNLFSEDFVKYVDDYVENDKKKSNKDLNAIQYDYNLPIKMLTKSKGIVTPIQNTGSLSVMGSSSSTVYEILDEKDWILENYEIVAGNYSSKPNELMLVVDSENKVDIKVAQYLGLPYEVDTESGKYAEIKYVDIVDKCEYVLALNNAIYDDDFNGLSFDTIPDNISNNQLKYQQLFNDAKNLDDFDVKNDGLLKLKISGVLRVKDNVETEILSSGLVYTSSLRELYNENATNSKIVKEAEKRIQTNIDNGITGDLVYNIELPWIYTIDVSEMAMMGMSGNYIFKSTGEYSGGVVGVNNEGLVLSVNNKLNMGITHEQAYNMALQGVGVTKMPASISFYPTSFDAKQNIVNLIEDWNKTEKGSKQNILYTDMTEILTNTMGQMIDIISYVLIAFAGISLVVSSVMIGIITYTSVVERKKEIGVLRSIGARKKDISRIFNSETILVGFFSGLLGVLISWVLTFPISAIIKAVAGGAITTSMAILEFGDALTLVVISTILTTIAGTVPAYIASKKDPVTCLRSE